jgi:hypothetical protein
MKRVGCQYLVIARPSKRPGVRTSILTRRTVINMITMGTTECIATHSVQWSASPADAWTCITWATASRASNTRHRTVTTFKALCFEWEPLRTPA